MTQLRYQAVVLASADGAHEYSIESGTITIDDTWTPYLQPSLVVTVPLEAATFSTGSSVPQIPAIDQVGLEFLDPENDNTLTLQANLYLYDESSGDLTVQSTISCSLAIENRTVDWAGGTVSLVLATDEFELQKNGNITAGPINFRAHQSSLIAVVNAVLAAAGLAATLDASSTDADVTTTVALTNLVGDPRTQASANVTAITGTATFTASQSTAVGVNPSGFYQKCVWAAATTNPGVWFCGTSASPVSVSGASTLFMAVSVDPGASGTVQFVVDQFDSTGHELSSTAVDASTETAGTWGRMTATVALRENTASICVGVVAVGAQAAGFTLNFSSPLVCANPYGLYETDGVTPLAYWDGTTAANTYYTYAWDTEYDGTTTPPDHSTSTRTPLPTQDRTPDSLTLTPGQSYWDMLQPVVSAAGLSLLQDEAGVWRLVDGTTYTLPGTVVAQVSNATAMTDEIDETDSSNVANAIVCEYTWTDASGNTQTRYDAAGTEGPVRLVQYANTPYPGPGKAAYLLALQQGRGRVMAVQVVNDFSARPYMSSRIIAPYTQTQVGQLSRVSWDVAAGEMQLTSTGLTSTPEGAWGLLSDSKEWGNINAATEWSQVADDLSNL